MSTLATSIQLSVYAFQPWSLHQLDYIRNTEDLAPLGGGMEGNGVEWGCEWWEELGKLIYWDIS